MQGLDIIIFAAVAVFFILKLLGVLGQNSEEEETPPNKSKNNIIDFHSRYQKAKKIGKAKQPLSDDDNGTVVVDLSTNTAEQGGSFHSYLSELEIKPTSKIGKGLKKIRQNYTLFNPIEFIQGAEAAFEMILTAYAKGDVIELKKLLTTDIYKLFQQTIKEREKKGERLELTILAINTIKIIEADIRNREFIITLEFETEQNSVTYDKNDKIIAGDPKDNDMLKDVWSMTKPINSNNPNWYLAATGSVEN